MNFLEILLSEVPCTSSQQFVSATVSLHLLGKAVERPLQLTQPILEFVNSNTTEHQLLTLPKNLGWCPDTQKKRVRGFVVHVLTCLTMSNELSATTENSRCFLFLGGKQG